MAQITHVYIISDYMDQIEGYKLGGCCSTNNADELMNFIHNKYHSRVTNQYDTFKYLLQELLLLYFYPGMSSMTEHCLELILFIVGICQNL